MIEDLFGQAYEALTQVGWFVALVVSFLILREFWLVYLSHKFMRKRKWVMLEINIPKDNIKTPQSMEQVFQSLHGSYTFGLSKHDRYVKGEVEPWMTLEMVGFSHSIHFYARVWDKYRNMVESAFFSQYPEAEIYEVEDYMKSLPAELPNARYEVFGTDWILKKEDAYPIRTYRDLEISGRDDEQMVDPIASVAEVMSNLKNNELILLQLNIRPTGSDWHKDVQKVVDKLMGQEQKKPGTGAAVGEFARNLASAPFVQPQWSGAPEDGSKPFLRFRTPGEEEVLKAVHRKMEKAAFEVAFRFVYIDDRKEFTQENVWAVFGALRQFYAPERNFFAPNMKTLTLHKKTLKIPIRPIRKVLLKKRKKKLYQAYRERAILHKPQIPNRQFNIKMNILTSEELASIFHPPGEVVKAPKLQPLKSRKGEPPVDLPIKSG